MAIGVSGSSHQSSGSNQVSEMPSPAAAEKGKEHHKGKPLPSLLYSSQASLGKLDNIYAIILGQLRILKNPTFFKHAYKPLIIANPFVFLLTI